MTFADLLQALGSTGIPFAGTGAFSRSINSINIDHKVFTVLV